MADLDEIEEGIYSPIYGTFSTSQKQELLVLIRYQRFRIQSSGQLTGVFDIFSAENRSLLKRFCLIDQGGKLLSYPFFTR